VSTLGWEHAKAPRTPLALWPHPLWPRPIGREARIASVEIPRGDQGSAARTAVEHPRPIRGRRSSPCPGAKPRAQYPRAPRGRHTPSPDFPYVVGKLRDPESGSIPAASTKFLYRNQALNVSCPSPILVRRSSLTWRRSQVDGDFSGRRFRPPQLGAGEPSSHRMKSTAARRLRAIREPRHVGRTGLRHTVRLRRGLPDVAVVEAAYPRKGHDSGSVARGLLHRPHLG
jgi:hypothetical protein